MRFDWPALHLVGDDTRIAIYPWVYREPHALFSEVGKHVRHLLPKQPETPELPLSPGYFSVTLVVMFSLHFLCACGMLLIRESLKPRQQR